MFLNILMNLLTTSMLTTQQLHNSFQAVGRAEQKIILLWTVDFSAVSELKYLTSMNPGDLIHYGVYAFTGIFGGFNAVLAVHGVTCLLSD